MGKNAKLSLFVAQICLVLLIVDVNGYSMARQSVESKHDDSNYVIKVDQPNEAKSHLKPSSLVPPLAKITDTDAMTNESNESNESNKNKASQVEKQSSKGTSEASSNTSMSGGAMSRLSGQFVVLWSDSVGWIATINRPVALTFLAGLLFGLTLLTACCCLCSVLVAGASSGDDANPADADGADNSNVGNQACLCSFACYLCNVCSEVHARTYHVNRDSDLIASVFDGTGNKKNNANNDQINGGKNVGKTAIGGKQPQCRGCGRGGVANKSSDKANPKVFNKPSAKDKQEGNSNTRGGVVVNIRVDPAATAAQKQVPVAAVTTAPRKENQADDCICACSPPYSPPQV